MTAKQILSMNRTVDARERANAAYWDAYYSSKAELDAALKTLMYRSTDGEYTAFVSTIRNTIRPLAIEAVKRELSKLSADYPEVTIARHNLEEACLACDNARANYGDDSEATNDAVAALILADVALEEVLETKANHPEILDEADDARMIDDLRHGG